MSSSPIGKFWKLIPFVLLLLIAIAARTNVFSVTIHAMVSKVLQDLGTKLLPFSINCVIGFAIIATAHYSYQIVVNGMYSLVDATKAGEHIKRLIKQIIQVVYWLVVGFMVLCLIAPNMLGTITTNFTLFGAAVMLSLQDLAKDAAGGFMLQFSPPHWRKCDVGDKIVLVGLESVTGTVKDIGLLNTRVETSQGLVTVPNREFLARSVIKLNA